MGLVYKEKHSLHRSKFFPVWVDLEWDKFFYAPEGTSFSLKSRPIASSSPSPYELPRMEQILSLKSIPWKGFIMKANVKAEKLFSSVKMENMNIYWCMVLRASGPGALSLA